MKPFVLPEILKTELQSDKMQHPYSRIYNNLSMSQRVKPSYDYATMCSARNLISNRMYTYIDHAKLMNAINDSINNKMEDMVKQAIEEVINMNTSDTMTSLCSEHLRR